MTTQEEKQALRRAMRTGTGALSPQEKARQAAEVFARIEALPEFRRARTVGFFCSLPDELPTRAALTRWAAVKRVALPVVEGDTMTFRLYTPPPSPRCAGDGPGKREEAEKPATGEMLRGLSPGAFGIDEPASGRVIGLPEIDLLIVPGMAFDGRGVRLGRGKGYYDRFWAHNTHNGQRLRASTPIPHDGSAPDGFAPADTPLPAATASPHKSTQTGRPYTIGVCFAHQAVRHVPCEPHDLRVDRVIAALQF